MRELKLEWSVAAWQEIWVGHGGSATVVWFWNGKRSVVFDVVDGMIWISSVGGGV